LTIIPTAYGTGNLQCYVAGKNNVKVSNGTLTITARIQAMKGKHFTSGRIRQIGNGTKYGKYLFRARLPNGKHLWPALWLKTKLKTCYNEIDTLEIKGVATDRLILTAWSGRSKKNLVKQSKGIGTGIDLSAAFHVYEVIWNSTRVTWLMDGVTYFTVDLKSPVWTASKKDSCPLGVLNLPQNVILNLAVGGSMFNFTPLTTAEAKDSWKKPVLEVDYVQIYQLQ